MHDAWFPVSGCVFLLPVVVACSHCLLSLLPILAAYPCCLSLLPILAAYPCCLSLLPILAACPYCLAELPITASHSSFLSCLVPIVAAQPCLPPLIPVHASHPCMVPKCTTASSLVPGSQPCSNLLFPLRLLATLSSKRDSLLSCLATSVCTTTHRQLHVCCAQIHATNNVQNTQPMWPSRVTGCSLFCF